MKPSSSPLPLSSRTESQPFMKASIKVWIDNAAASLQQVSESPRLDAEVLLSHVIGADRSWLFAHFDHFLSLQEITTADDLLSREVSGTPLPYLLGHWQFYNLDFIVNQDVLIPRPETEILVEKAIEWLNTRNIPALVVDIGTGSGCIAVSIAMNYPDCTITAADISNPALEIARLNIAKYHLNHRIATMQSNLMEELTDHYDLICANLPYIPRERLTQLSVSKSEPLSALDGGNQGLELITDLLVQAKEKLQTSGCILAEIDYTQAGILASLTRDLFPSKQVNILNDLAGLPRILEIK